MSPSRVEDPPNHCKHWGFGMTPPVVSIRPIALSMSVDSFERYVMADVRCIRRGRLRLFPVVELESWANANAERTLPEDA